MLSLDSTESRYLYKSKDFIIGLLDSEVLDFDELTALVRNEENKIKREISLKKFDYDKLDQQIESILNPTNNNKYSIIKKLLFKILPFKDNTQITEEQQMNVAELQAKQNVLKQEILDLEVHLNKTRELIFEESAPSVIQENNNKPFTQFIALQDKSSGNKELNESF